MSESEVVGIIQPCLHPYYYKICGLVARYGLSFSRVLFMFPLPVCIAEEIYWEYREKPFFDKMIRYMTKETITMLYLDNVEGVAAKWQELLCATELKNATASVGEDIKVAAHRLIPVSTAERINFSFNAG